MSLPNSTLEKVGLLVLAAIAVGALAVIAFMSLKAGTLDPNAATLLGAIATGLVAFAKDIVAAIRGYSMSAQLGKVTDQLAAAGPVVDPDKPQPVTVVNDDTNAVPVETK
jgi:hypothetical protein